MTFRLRTVFYVFALLASAMATFGPGGIVVAAVVLGLWLWVFLRQRRLLFDVLVIIAVFGMLVALLLPAMEPSRGVWRSHSCRMSLKDLGRGLIEHDAALGSLPPAWIADANGKPMLSWRVAILPFIDQQSLYQRINRTMPWDSPANKGISSAPSFYEFQCANDDTGSAVNYFAVVGAQTAWPETKGVRLADIGDEKTNTILLIEARGGSRSWAEPRDLSFEEAVDLLSRPLPDGEGHVVDNGFFYKQSRGRNVAFADGSVAFLQRPISRELATALLTINSHESIDANDIDAAAPDLDYAKGYVCGLFVFLSLLPIAWVRRNAVEESGGV